VGATVGSNGFAGFLAFGQPAGKLNEQQAIPGRRVHIHAMSFLTAALSESGKQE